MKYRRREPEILDAVQYDGMNGDEVMRICRGCADRRPGMIGVLRVVHEDRDGIQSLLTFTKGSWAIWTADGPDVYSDADFRRLFEPVEES